VENRLIFPARVRLETPSNHPKTPVYLLLETNGDLAVYEGEYPNKVNLLWTGTRTAAGCGTPTMFRWRYYFTIKIGGQVVSTQEDVKSGASYEAYFQLRGRYYTNELNVTKSERVGPW
jgi:hypothetical protein